MKALVLGCSHAAGSEMEQGPNIPSYATLDEFYAHGRTRSYPVKIAQKLGYQQVINASIPGGSNDAMFRLFESTPTDANDLVIACWTGINRSEMFDNDQWVALAPGKTIDSDYQDYLKLWLCYSANDPVGRLNKIKNIVALNSLAQVRKTKVINIDSFWPVPNFDSYGCWPVDCDFWSWCHANNFSKTEWGHFFEDAHQAFAEFVVDNLQKTQTLGYGNT